jgi:NitT/TauT family transport system substrate-binding protein
MKKVIFLLLTVVVIGCSSKNEEYPEFSLAWSEYPSWSVFGVAHEKGLINGKKGQLGPIEKKYGVDIVLREADYDTCLTLFGSGTVDASCQTNIDSLAPSLGRASVVIMPTSTSVGADACIVTNYKEQGLQALFDFLQANTTYGLEKSVSQYVFERNLQLLNSNVKFGDYKFKNMDPAAASQAMQTNQTSINSIVVWNPFVLQTLRTRRDAQVLFDSSTIPEEIIDCIVVSRDSLNRKGGKEFALAVMETYYTICKMLDDPKEGDATYVALGAKFSSLNAEDMRIVCKQTRFYNTPDKALALFESKKFQNETTPMITDFCLSHQMVKEKPAVGFNNSGSQLNFDTTHMKEYKKK